MPGKGAATDGASELMGITLASKLFQNKKGGQKKKDVRRMFCELYQMGCDGAPQGSRVGAGLRIEWPALPLTASLLPAGLVTWELRLRSPPPRRTQMTLAKGKGKAGVPPPGRHNRLPQPC